MKKKKQNTSGDLVTVRSIQKQHSVSGETQQVIRADKEKWSVTSPDQLSPTAPLLRGSLGGTTSPAGTPTLSTAHQHLRRKPAARWRMWRVPGHGGATQEKRPQAPALPRGAQLAPGSRSDPIRGGGGWHPAHLPQPPAGKGAQGPHKSVLRPPDKFRAL